MSRSKSSLRFSDEDVMEMRRMLFNGATLNEVAQRFQTSREYARQIKMNQIRRGIGIDASGIRSLTAQPRYTHLRSDIQRHYLFGERRVDIAKRFSVPAGRVWWYTKALPRNVRRPNKITVEQWQEIRRLRLDEGWTQREVAQHLAVSQGSVFRYTHKELP